MPGKMVVPEASLGYPIGIKYMWIVLNNPILIGQDKVHVSYS